MSLQQKTFVETLKEKLKPGVKVYVTSKGKEATSMYDAFLLLEEGVIREVDWDGEDCEFLIEFEGTYMIPSDISFRKGWLSTYEGLTPSDKTLLWSTSPDESYVDTEGNFNRYDEEDEIERIKALPDDENLVNDMVKSPFDIQHGGNHYKEKGIQPLEYIMANNLDFCQGNVIKYVSRYKSKNGRQDLEKAKHYIDFLIWQWDRENK